MKFKTLFRNIRRSAVKHSPEILVGLGILGLGTTVVMAVKATPKALSKIEEEVIEREDLGSRVGISVEELPKMLPLRDKFRVTWKCYVPAAITGTLSVACIIGASAVNAKRNAALATAYTIAEGALHEYSNKVKELVGEEKAKEIHNAIVEERMAKSEPMPPAEDPDVPERFYDIWAGRSFYSTENQVISAVNDVNARINSYMSASLNELYYDLKVPTTEGGEKQGWNTNTGLIKCSFVPVFDDSGKACKGIRLTPPPVYDYTRII